MKKIGGGGGWLRRISKMTHKSRKLKSQKWRIFCHGLGCLIEMAARRTGIVITLGCNYSCLVAIHVAYSTNLRRSGRPVTGSQEKRGRVTRSILPSPSPRLFSSSHSPVQWLFPLLFPIHFIIIAFRLFRILFYHFNLDFYRHLNGRLMHPRRVRNLCGLFSNTLRWMNIDVKFAPWYCPS